MPSDTDSGAASIETPPGIDMFRIWAGEFLDEKPADQDASAPAKSESGSDSAAPEGDSDPKPEAQGESSPAKADAERKVVRVTRPDPKPASPPPPPSESDFERYEEDAESGKKEDAPASDEILSRLLPEEKDRYDLVAYAAKNIGGKFAGEDRKLLDYFKKNEAKLSELRDADPGFDPEDSTEYSKWLAANAPRLSRSDEREIVKHQVKSETLAETRKETGRIDSDLKRRDAKAKSDLEVVEARARMQEAVPEDLFKEMSELAKSAGTEPGAALQAIADAMPFEHDIVNRELARADAAISELIEIFSGAKPSVEATPALLDDVVRVGKEFAEKGGASLIRDGKRFVTRAEFASLKPAARTRFWTWSKDELFDALRADARDRISSSVAAVRTRVESYVKRKAPAQEPKPAEPKPVPRKSGALPPAPMESPSGGKGAEKNNALLQAWMGEE